MLDKDFEIFFSNKQIKIPASISMDSEWKERVQESWWGSSNQYYSKDDIRKLTVCTDEDFINKIWQSVQVRNKLLSLGGEEACMSLTDEDHSILLSDRAILFSGKSTLRKGQPSQCHQNSCDLWVTNSEDYRICTGYALSEDGMWRCHSWLVQLTKNEKGECVGKIIETTVKRIAYFGYIMTAEECRNFVEENF